MVMELCKDILGKGYHVYCNNYYTSIHLAADLLEHGITLVGTTRPDKVDFPKGIVNKGAIAGESRRITVSTTIDNKVHCFAWLAINHYILLTLSLAAPHILQFLGVFQTNTD